ncbi:MAG: hypothetical protein M1837_006405 [Sclerophora amabilis]|nr:MAG: hypothetical protein M1837_006405 [Sclerophora amabilis]
MSIATKSPSQRGVGPEELKSEPQNAQYPHEADDYLSMEHTMWTPTSADIADLCATGAVYETDNETLKNWESMGDEQCARAHSDEWEQVIYQQGSEIDRLRSELEGLRQVVDSLAGWGSSINGVIGKIVGERIQNNQVSDEEMSAIESWINAAEQDI